MHVLFGSQYNYPQCYDIAFQTYTQMEADFIEAACHKYCPSSVRRLLEPACGSGRLITELAGRGYEMVGFDLTEPALSYLRRRLTRRRLCAETFRADMADFRLEDAVDGAYCTINTFRELLTDQSARSHLECVARSLRPGGIYILGFRVLPSSGAKRPVRRWTERRAQTKVTVTLRVLGVDLPRRIENFRISLLVRRGSKEVRLRHEFELRTYTAKQFRRLLDSVSLLELCDIYDSQHNIERPLSLNDEMTYTLFVLRRPSLRKGS
jgi:SAM-dependent methyltransferase